MHPSPIAVYSILFVLTSISSVLIRLHVDLDLFFIGGQSVYRTGAVPPMAYHQQDLNLGRNRLTRLHSRSVLASIERGSHFDACFFVFLLFIPLPFGRYAASPPHHPTMSAPTVIDGHAIQAQFANLTEERDRYHRETDEAKAALQQTESNIAAQHSHQGVLSQQIQARSDALGRSDRDVQQLRARLDQVRRQRAAEAAEMVQVASQLDDIEGRIVESKTRDVAELDGLNDELDAAMNRYDEGRIVRHLTVESIEDGLLPRIRTMIESEQMKMVTTTSADGSGNGNGGGNGDDDDEEENATAMMELDGAGNGSGGGGGGGGGGGRAQKLQDLSDQMEASLGRLRDATNRLGTAARTREQIQEEIGTLRSTMMQGRNRDGRVSGSSSILCCAMYCTACMEWYYILMRCTYILTFLFPPHIFSYATPQFFTELDLTELEAKWSEEVSLHPQEDDPTAMGAGGGAGGVGALPNLPSGTANLDLFYNAASQEEDMPPMMEVDNGGHGVGVDVGGGMVAMEASKTIAEGGAAGGATVMEQ